MTAPTEPALRTFVWLRRGSWFSLGVLLLLATSWAVVCHAVRQRFDEAMGRLHQDGVALKIADLQPPVVEDRDNAAWHYQQAFGAISKDFDTPRNSVYESEQLGDAPRFTAFWQTLVERSEAENAGAFAFAREARGHDAVDWGWKFRSPAIAILLPSLNDSRQLTNVVADGAERSFFVGDSREGLERIRDILQLARQTARTPFLVNSLVANGIDSVACASILGQVSSIRVGDAPGMATRESIHALQQELMRPEPMERMAAAMRVEMTGLLDEGELMMRQAHVGRPAIMADLVRVAERYLKLIEAANASTNAQREQLIDEAKPAAAYRKAGLSFGIMGTGTSPAKPINAAWPISHTLGAADYRRAMATSANTTALRDAAAIALAIRMYELNHGGLWPITLNELVPGYLPWIPKNRSTIDDAPYRYELISVPGGKDRPVLIRNGQPVHQSPKIYHDGAGPFIDLASYAEPEHDASMPATLPAIAPHLQPSTQP